MKSFVKRANYFKMLDRDLELLLTLKVAEWEIYVVLNYLQLQLCCYF